MTLQAFPVNSISILNNNNKSVKVFCILHNYKIGNCVVTAYRAMNRIMSAQENIHISLEVTEIMTNNNKIGRQL